MPGIDGIDLLKKIETSDHYNGCPIFFISGDVSLESRIKTYETGGIDFFDRSLTEHEIVTRLINKIKLFQAGASVLEVGNLRIDTTSHVVQIAGRVIDLTMVEMRLLGLILRTFPSEISKREIMAKIWENDPKDGKLSVHLSNLGNKLWGWNHQIRVKGDAISVHAI
jgi:DNA-binding response OmpR family regulator